MRNEQLLSRIVASAATGMLALSCAVQSDPDFAISPRSRATNPVVDPITLGQLVDSNNDFAVDLFQIVRAGEGNFVVAPLSISLALATTMPGMRGVTASEMAQALHIELEPAEMHAAFNLLEQSVARIVPGPEPGSVPFRLRMENELWGERGLAYAAEFLDVLAVNYGAGVHLVDFAADSEAARSTINGWARDQTHGSVRAFLDEGSISPGTRLLLTGSTEYAAGWLEPFDRANSDEARFERLDGGQVETLMMSGTFPVPYAAGADYQAVEIAYAGGAVAMDLLVPELGTYHAFELALDMPTLRRILDGLTISVVNLSMPRFRVETQLGLVEPLDRLGIRQAFSPELADLSAVADAGVDLFLTDVVQRAIVSASEAGSEGAVGRERMVPGSASSRTGERLVIDRPFVFLIRDLGTGQILFIGRVLDPTD